MKKLGAILCTDDTWSEYDEYGVRTDDISANAVLKRLIDLVNSQQEAIEKLENRHTGEYCEVCNTTGHKPADDKPEKVTLHDIVTNTPEGSAAVDRALERSAERQNEMKRKAEEIRDTHRTVTLRIPKGMRIGEAITSIRRGVGVSDFYLWLCEAPDTDLQKVLDEVQPNE